MTTFDRRGRSITLVLGAVALLAASGCAARNLVPLESQSEFQKQVLSSDRPVLANFYKDEGCPTCVAADPILDQPAGEYEGRVAFDQPTALTGTLSGENGVKDNIEFVVARPRGTECEVAENAITVPVEKTISAPGIVDANLDNDIAAVFATDSVLAEVGGEPITLYTVLGPVRDDVRRWGKECTREEFQDRCRGLVALRVREVVTQRLLVEEARTQLSQDERQRLAGMSGTGAVAGDEILVQAFLREKIAPQIRVSQSEMLAHYRKVVDQRYVLPSEVRMGLITIRKSDSATPQWAESLARAVHSRAVGGEDFAKLAQRYGRDKSAANGGDCGFVHRGAVEVKAVEEVLFALSSGQVAPLMETPEAFYIVKSLDRHEGRTLPFDEVQSVLEQELRDQKYKARVAAYALELYQRWQGQYKTATAPETLPAEAEDGRVVAADR
jgi:thiol-disulfide isomerase/thioredoxin